MQNSYDSRVIGFELDGREFVRVLGDSPSLDRFYVDGREVDSAEFYRAVDTAMALSWAKMIQT